MRCLETAEGLVLSQIDDFTKIPSALVNGTSFQYVGSIVSYASSQPSWLTVVGDSLYKSTKDNMNVDKVSVLDNEYFSFDCPSGDYIASNYQHVNGLRTYNKVNSSYIGAWGVDSSGFTNPSASYREYYAPVIVLDDENQRGYIFVIVYSNNIVYNTGWQIGAIGGRVNGVDYIWEIYGNQVTYNWQSVPSISGKNGILSLVTLDSESINDGEPVSGAAVSVFDQAPSNDNNIKNLADTYGGGEESSAVDVTVKYKVTLPPGGSFSTLKIVAKKDSIPEDVSDGDKIIDISPSKTKKTVTGLDENSLYYFKIFGEDTNSNTSESDEKHITTSADEGWIFDYTGSIQTFVAPKTGIYQLETWGAQGGDATDGTLTARGGYGAYAVGEVLLNQGDTLYINVGGQNGYGGGGNYVSAYTLEQIIRCQDWNNDQMGSNIDTDYLTFSVMFSDLTSYFDDNFIFKGGKKNSRNYLGRTDGNNYYLSDGRDCGYGIPLYGKNISSITFDCKIDGYYNEYTEILIELVYCDLSNQVTSQYLMQIVKLPTSESHYDFTVEDNDWHTFTKTFDTSLLVNWITIVFAGRPGNVKNVHFICTD